MGTVYKLFTGRCMAHVERKGILQQAHLGLENIWLGSRSSRGTPFENSFEMKCARVDFVAKACPRRFTC